MIIREYLEIFTPEKNITCGGQKPTSFLPTPSMELKKKLGELTPLTYPKYKFRKEISWGWQKVKELFAYPKYEIEKKISCTVNFFEKKRPLIPSRRFEPLTILARSYC